MVTRERQGHLEIWDAACDACAACAMGIRDACEAPLEPGPDDDPRWRVRDAGDAAVLDVAAWSHDVVSQHAGRPAVLVLGGGPRARAAALAAAGAGAWPVVVLGAGERDETLTSAADERDLRRLFAPAVHERADLVLAVDGDLARAARLVRRGGALASPEAAATRPSITTMVQRELELRAARDRVQAALACRLEG